MDMIVKIIGTRWCWAATRFRQGWGKHIALALLFFLSIYGLVATDKPLEQLQIQSGPITWSAAGR